jgi:WD40 repeat protein
VVQTASLDRRAADSELTAGAWDMHHSSKLAVAQAGSVLGFDLRDSGTAAALNIPGAHTGRIRDIDYNPNKPYCMMTCGDDCAVRFWDLRHTGASLCTLRGHSHWVWTSRYNPFHDQLVLSAGTDATVSLWRVSSISSAPLLDIDPDDEDMDDPAAAEGKSRADMGSQAAEMDALVNSFSEHEESVYAVSWSLSDAWTFASVSFDGRMVINHVPSAEKYKILL